MNPVGSAVEELLQIPAGHARWLRRANAVHERESSSLGLVSIDQVHEPGIECRQPLERSDGTDAQQQ